MELLKVEHIVKTYGEGANKTEALKGVSFDITKGEFVSIMGPSGSGKSTLLHILGFLDRATSGNYYFDGDRLDDLNDEELAKTRNKKMGFVFQAFNLLSRTTVVDNIALPLLYSNVDMKRAREMAIKAAEAVGLSHRVDHESSELSGGEKQRVAIARALVVGPLVIFADEPTGNLDSKSGLKVMEILEDLNKSGTTVILITHERETAEYADRIIYMVDGGLDREEKVKDKGNKKELK